MMYKEKLDTGQRRRSSHRVQQFSQSEVYRKDIRPWIMDRMRIARMRIYDPETPEERTEAVAILGVTEMFLEFIEDIGWEKRWGKPVNLDPETKKVGLLERLKKVIPARKKK
jgi:hypothetical protein